MPSWEDIPIQSELAFVEADKKGLEVRVADDKTLQLDIDSDEAFDQYQRYADRLIAHFNSTTVTVTTSRKGNRHVYIGLEHPMTVPERIALQACLGSDPTREFLSLKRWLDKDPNPILLFEVKPKLLTEGGR
jgi:hypothetical protein